MAQRTMLLAGVLVLTALALWPAPGAFAQQAAPSIASRTYVGTDAGTILGRQVRDSEGADVGLLVDVLVDKDGKPLAGVIDVGGFLGVGTRRVAIAWRLLRFASDNGETVVHMNLTFDSAAAVPEDLGPNSTFIVIDSPSP